MSGDSMMKYADEIQLVKEAQSGSRAAFAELVCRYRTAAYAAAYVRLRNHHDAEDIAQEAFLTAYEKISTLIYPEKFGAWLCAIASRKAMRRRSKKANEAKRLETIAEQNRLTEEGDMWESLAAGELRKVVHALIANLSRIHREAIELYYLQGYSVEEVAKFLDVPQGTVKRRLFDARQKLKHQLSETFD